MVRLRAGQYLFLEHADPIGHEAWSATETEAGGRHYASEGATTFPQSHTTRLVAEVDAAGLLQRLMLETLVEGEDAPRRFRATLAEGVLYHVERQDAPGHAEELVPIGSRAFLDFPSPILTTVMLRRLALAEGDGREFDAVLVSPLTFELTKQRYGFERLPDERVRTAAGEFDARAYRYASLGTRYTGRVWTDEDDNVLKYEDAWDLVEYEEAAASAGAEAP